MFSHSKRKSEGQLYRVFMISDRKTMQVDKLIISSIIHILQYLTMTFQFYIIVINRLVKMYLHLCPPQSGGGCGQDHVHLWADWDGRCLWSGGGGRSAGSGQTGQCISKIKTHLNCFVVLFTC